MSLHKISWIMPRSKPTSSKQRPPVLIERRLFVVRVFFFSFRFSPSNFARRDVAVECDSHLDADQRMWPASFTRTGPETEFGQFATIKNVTLSPENKISK